MKAQRLNVALASLMLAGCVAPANRLSDEARQVHVRLDSGFNADGCQWKGSVTGSEGHWYNYLFYPNDVMMHGALNDIKNQAAALGANTVYLIAPQDFTTSFSVLGSAYWCD
ncbi:MULTISPECIES: DUF4156 domain-containing protein [Vibrio]|uniref:Outer membrane lipoprotein n=1 Tax=Vibrio proteolyticus NBRC 13287 TaxID=1219065 RepID=U3BI89_VIBPR|nr:MULTISPECIES: DUF4156 domain-containing protein [Vibrio]NAX23354.1 DUF4156 domain-containing protein [Vibrio sp. V39_P1S14PM300]GAD66378.1 hypothetical protein VPR01S_03_02880 [Vibrio proteolyticus NBRC 13287]